jgi:hypothetical protein
LLAYRSFERDANSIQLIFIILEWKYLISDRRFNHLFLITITVWVSTVIGIWGWKTNIFLGQKLSNNSYKTTCSASAQIDSHHYIFEVLHLCELNQTYSSPLQFFV